MEDYFRVVGNQEKEVGRPLTVNLLEQEPELGKQKGKLSENTNEETLQRKN